MNSTYDLAALLVPMGARVLDVGSGRGEMIRQCTEMGCEVTALDISADALAAAKAAGAEVFAVDLESPEQLEVIAEREFDVVLCLDVLEHLRDGIAVLRRLSEQLAPKGYVLVSLPNVTHGAVRWQLMNGAFRYTSDGLLDTTHVRFFDRESATALVHDAGLRIVDAVTIERALTMAGIDIKLDDLDPSVHEAILAGPDSRVFQWFFRACAPDSVVACSPPGLQLYVDGLAAERQIAESTAYCSHVKDELERTERQLAETSAHCRHVEGELERVSLLAARSIASEEDQRRYQDRCAELEARCNELERELRLRCAEIDAALADGRYLGVELARTEERQAGVQAKVVQLEAEREVLARAFADLSARHAAVMRSSTYRVGRRAVAGLRQVPGLRRLLARLTRAINRPR